MLTKLLFTAIILIGGIFLLRLRAGGRPRYTAPPLVVAMPRPRRFRWFVYALAGVLVAGTAAFSAYLWHAQHRVVRVRVINTQVGSEVTYRALQGGVDLGAGRFVTLDGQEVVPASVERVEITPE